MDGDSKILLVEDAIFFQSLVIKTLNDYQIDCAETVEKAIEIYDSSYDLILLDLHLPDGNGYHFLEYLSKTEKNNMPTVFCLTEEKNVDIKVAAFDLGVSDYITKPINSLELRARVKAAIKRLHRLKTEATKLEFKGIYVDLESMNVFISSDSKNFDKEISLTQKELKILLKLLEKPNQLCTREDIQKAAWENKSKPSSRTIDVHVHSLRKKLGTQGQFLRSVSGQGYKLAED